MDTAVLNNNLGGGHRRRVMLQTVKAQADSDPIGVNLIDPDTCTNGCYWINRPMPYSSGFYTDYIPVVAGHTYEWMKTLAGTNRACEYDADKNYLGLWANCPSGNGLVEYTPTHGVSFVIISGVMARADDGQLFVNPDTDWFTRIR